MLIRIRSSQGMLKFETIPEERIHDLKAKVAEKLGVSPDEIALARDQTGNSFLGHDLNATISSEKIVHGDMIFVGIRPGASFPSNEQTQTKEKEENTVIEDDVDIELEKLDGRVIKKRENSNSMKLEDLPIEPYDPSYLEEKKIKHMSFHAYLRRLKDKQQSSGLSDKLKLLNDEVEELKTKVIKKEGTKVNMKDLPQPILLSRQSYRHVDHIEFVNSVVIEGFLSGWRETGVQRFAYLYGFYAPFTDSILTLGIKAVVTHIYEPPQQGSKDGVELTLPDEDEEKVNQIGLAFGLTKVGMIYTDLIDDGTGKGKVLYKRHLDTYFLSSPEIVFAAIHQNNHPNPCKYSNTGKYGSKFVTVIVSGDEDGNVSLEGYQVSQQAMALIAANCCSATVEANLMTINNDSSIYIPEIMFKTTNEYGTAILHKANPIFPVEHLIVNVTTGFPRDPNPLFLSPKVFPLIENRYSEIDYIKLKNYLSEGSIYENLSDFHLLLFILKSETFDLENDYTTLIEAIKLRDKKILDQLLRTQSWKTFLLLINEAATAAMNPNRNTPNSSQGSNAITKEKVASTLQILKDMGFPDENLNFSILKANGGSLEGALAVLTS